MVDTKFNAEEESVTYDNKKYFFHRGKGEASIYVKLAGENSQVFLTNIFYEGSAKRPRLRTLWEIFVGYRRSDGKKEKLSR